MKVAVVGAGISGDDLPERREEQIIRGASHIQFAANAAEELYEKLPVLGTLMRWSKRQAAN